MSIQYTTSLLPLWLNFILKAAFILQTCNIISKLFTISQKRNKPQSKQRNQRREERLKLKKSQFSFWLGGWKESNFYFTIITFLTKAKHLRQAILKKAFNGRLVARDPGDEPAAKLFERIREEKAKIKAQSKGSKKRKAK